MTPRRRVPSTARRGGAALLAVVTSASLASVPAGALTGLPVEGGAVGAGSEVLTPDPTVDPTSVTTGEGDDVLAGDPLEGLVETVGTAVDGLAGPLVDDDPPATGGSPAPTSTDPAGDAGSGTSPSSGSHAGPAAGAPAEGTGRTVVPADDGAAATAPPETRTQPAAAPTVVVVRSASEGAGAAPVASPGAAGFPRSLTFHLPDSDRFAGRPARASGAPTGVRSTAEVVALLGGLALTPAQLAKVFAPFPVAGRASYSDEGGAAGTDLFAAAGTPIVAATAGTIERLHPGGLQLTGPDGTRYGYAGLGRLHPAAVDGGRVAKGQVLGFVAPATSRGSAPHLHFEIRTRSGVPVAPAPFLDRWLAEALATARTLERAPDGTLSIQAAGGRRTALAPVPRAATPEAVSPSAVHRMAAVANVDPSTAPWGGVLVGAALVAWFLATWPRLRRRRAAPPVGGLLGLD